MLTYGSRQWRHYFPPASESKYSWLFLANITLVLGNYVIQNKIDMKSERRKEQGHACPRSEALIDINRNIKTSEKTKTTIKDAMSNANYSIYSFKTEK